MLLLGVLQAQAAGAPVGAGSFDLLEQRVLDTAESSVTFSSLSTYAADYQHLQIRLAARTTRAATIDVVCMRFNGDTGSNYAIHRLQGNGSTVTSGGNPAQTNQFIGLAPGASAGASQFGPAVADILDPFETTKNKTTRAFTGITSDVVIYSNAWFNTNAVSEINIFPINLDNFVTGSRFSLYGIRGA